MYFVSISMCDEPWRVSVYIGQSLQTYSCCKTIYAKLGKKSEDAKFLRIKTVYTRNSGVSFNVEGVSGMVCQSPFPGFRNGRKTPLPVRVRRLDRKKHTPVGGCGFEEI